MMKAFLRNNAVFIGLSLMLIVALGLALLYIPKNELHLLLCDRHTPARDIFYRYYTHVAEWFPYVLCVFLLLFSRIGDGVLASAGLALSALTTQLFKHIINAPRPVNWFAQHFPDLQLPLVADVKMNMWYSFPSGHTTSFFALFFALSIILTQRVNKPAGSVIQVLCFLMAMLGGYSRIYLSQHFAADVLGGTVVGILITIVCYAVLSRHEGQKWYNYRVFAKKMT